MNNTLPDFLDKYTVQYDRVSFEPTLQLSEDVKINFSFVLDYKASSIDEKEVIRTDIKNVNDAVECDVILKFFDEVDNFFVSKRHYGNKVFEYDEDGVATTKLNEAFLAMSQGKYFCDYCPPTYHKPVNVKIIALNFTNIVWKPIKVKILDDLQTEQTTYENTLCGEQEVITVVPYLEDWVKLEYLSNFRKEQ